MFTLKRNPTKKSCDGLNKRATTKFDHLGKQCVWCCNASPNYTTLISSVESTVGKAVEWFFVTRSLEGDGRLPLLAPHSPPSHAALPMTAKLRCFYMFIFYQVTGFIRVPFRPALVCLQSLRTLCCTLHCINVSCNTGTHSWYWIQQGNCWEGHFLVDRKQSHFHTRKHSRLPLKLSVCNWSYLTNTSLR